MSQPSNWSQLSKRHQGPNPMKRSASDPEIWERRLGDEARDDLMGPCPASVAP